MGRTTSSSGRRVVVIGAGIGGLTAAALLARRGYGVKVFDQAGVAGGCASTFRRRGFTFDVGATQVAGLEPGGIHHQIFAELDLPLPEATPCDPACAVFLPGETEPIRVWRDPVAWRAERQRQFPGSEPFWQLMQRLFQPSWRFQGRGPVLPPRSPWDLWRLAQALRPETLVTVPYTFATVGQVLERLGLGSDAPGVKPTASQTGEPTQAESPSKNRRLKTFLDLQLKLYSQVSADETAVLYAATALGMAQAPQGLWHLHGSMQVLSDRLEKALVRDGGLLQLNHGVRRVHTAQGAVTGVTVENQKTGQSWVEPADQVVANVTVQNLVQLLGDRVPPGYQRRVEALPQGSGAFVLYLGVEAAAIPADCPPHLQFLYSYDGPIAENNTLFVSVSRPGDGRAPEGRATIVASSFTDIGLWWQTNDYEGLKQAYIDGAMQRLSAYFDLQASHLIHVEAATPRTFARFTARDRGSVGGLGMRVSTFGPFGFANRTPVGGLWLVGDCTHPGEGTAGVSYSAQTVVQQIEAL